MGKARPRWPVVCYALRLGGHVGCTLNSSGMSALGFGGLGACTRWPERDLLFFSVSNDSLDSFVVVIALLDCCVCSLRCDSYAVISSSTNI